MIGASILPELIRATVLSTRVVAEGTMPVSLFIVAPFEQGKTRLVLENSAEETLIVTDLSGMGLLECLLMNKNATTVIVNDLSVVMGHRQSVNKLTIAILNALAEEGSYKIAMPKMQHLDLRGRKVNVIACCVPELVSDRRNWWYKSGFMSRLLIVRFAHSVMLQLEIHKAIRDGVKDPPMSLLHVPAAPIKVSISEKHAATLLNLSTNIFKEHSETGYRKHKQIRSLACGHAILRSWKDPQVTAEDIKFIEECTPFFLQGAEI